MTVFDPPFMNGYELKSLIRLSEKEWKEISAEYLPLLPTDISIWRYSRPPLPQDPLQGWKIHISAMVLSASATLSELGPLLRHENALFKAPRSLEHLMKINSGIFYGYSQIGKFLTVYPRDKDHFRQLIKILHDSTVKFDAPAVPFDFCFKNRSNAFFRYGSFRKGVFNTEQDGNVPALISPTGELFADDRSAFEFIPKWEKKPISSPRRKPARNSGPLATAYRCFQAISQRGKGGTYLALDLRDGMLKTVVVKEGRKNGEATWDGRDGRSFLRNEKRALTSLRRNGINVPKVLDTFISNGNYYLVMERLEGMHLGKYIACQRERRLSASAVVDIARQLTSIVSQIHEAGWIWRDLKPSNIWIEPDGKLRPIDFEGACRVGRPCYLPWSTPVFAAPEARALGIRARPDFSEDMYSLGAVLYFLIKSDTPSQNLADKGECWKDIPNELQRLVDRLLRDEPDNRPSALEARRLLADVTV